MRRLPLLFLLLFLFSTETFAYLSIKKMKRIEDFSAEKLGEFPRSLRTFPFQKGKAKKVYRVEDEKGDRFLRAEEREALSVQVFRKFPWDLQEYPNLSWSWRPLVLPRGADERRSETNDSACGLYVPFGGYTGDVIKYVWSSTLPIGETIEKKEDFFIIVKGKGALPRWQTVKVNVQEDYRRLFKREPTKNPIGFGLLTDGNATHSEAVCDYDNFELSAPSN